MRANKNIHKLLVGIKTNITTFKNNLADSNPVDGAYSQWLRMSTLGVCCRGSRPGCSRRCAQVVSVATAESRPTESGCNIAVHSRSITLPTKMKEWNVCLSTGKNLESMMWRRKNQSGDTDEFHDTIPVKCGITYIVHGCVCRRPKEESW